VKGGDIQKAVRERGQRKRSKDQSKKPIGTE